MGPKKGAVVGGLLGAGLGLITGGVGWLLLGGGAVGALAAKARDGGLSDARLKELGERMTPNSSAIVAVVELTWVADVEREFAAVGADVVREVGRGGPRRAAERRLRRLLQRDRGRRRRRRDPHRRTGPCRQRNCAGVTAVGPFRERKSHDRWRVQFVLRGDHPQAQWHRPGRPRRPRRRGGRRGRHPVVQPLRRGADAGAVHRSRAGHRRRPRDRGGLGFRPAGPGGHPRGAPGDRWSRDRLLAGRHAVDPRRADRSVAGDAAGSSVSRSRSSAVRRSPAGGGSPWRGPSTSSSASWRWPGRRPRCWCSP